ncbi:MAG: RagB/SusD family nutrient uptake outer membrane protein [Bacteroides sp.]|nr:RagB/SusD family nutrient uptake outer membrane protein [Bacteroides sp.]
MKQILYTIVALLGIMMSTTACNDWLDVSPETEKKQEDMFSKETGYRNVLTGAYIRMKSTSLYGAEMVHGTVEMLAQHWNNSTAGTFEYYLSMYDYKASTVESAFSSIYSNLYKVIADVNGLLEDIDANKDVFKEDNYELIKAEALGIRAFCHFDILRLFGPMPTNLPSEAILPYVTTVSTTPNSKITYEAYTQNLLKDLQEAEDLFKDRDPICFKSIEKLNSISSSEDTYWGYRQMRMNYYAVCATKARVHLWMGNKTEALKYAKLVMDAKDESGNKMYRLGNSDDCARLDYTLSCEHIFNMNVYDLASTALGTARGYEKEKGYLTSKLYGSGSTDIRLTYMWDYVYDSYWWTYNNYFKKYLQSDNMPTLSKNSIPLIRLYEMYLIAMECSTLEEATTLYKDMCVARDIPSVTITDIAQLTNILVLEYNKEFYGEGQAFYAYKRLAIEDIFYALEPGSISTYVIPLPTSETI